MIVAEICKQYNESNTECILSINTVDSPLGKIICVADESDICLVAFENTEKLDSKFKKLHELLKCTFKENENNSILKILKEEFRLYFLGNLKEFTVPIKYATGSEFQKDVWEVLRKLPYSSTQSYGSVAKSMGRPASHSRAVGAACGANSHMILVPCHRLVSAGSTGGFNSGTDRKTWLIEHEMKHSS